MNAIDESKRAETDIFQLGESLGLTKEPSNWSSYIQACIDSLSATYKQSGQIQRLRFPNQEFLVGIPATAAKGLSRGAASILLRDGVVLAGPATLKCVPGTYGGSAFYRCITSDEIARLVDAGIDGLTIDGNRVAQGASVQATNVLLECSTNVCVSDVTSINANGSGIMLRGTKERVAKNLSVTSSRVRDCTKIGIQMSQFDTVQIERNDVRSCGDNGIDIYGDDGSKVSSASGFTITGNYVESCLTGIFLETCRDGKVESNGVSACKTGIHLNRIHGQPENILIQGNAIAFGEIGFSLTGYAKNISLLRNAFARQTLAVFNLGANHSGASGLTIARNIVSNTDAKYVVYAVGDILANCSISANVIAMTKSDFGRTTESSIAVKTVSNFSNTQWSYRLSK